MDPLWSETCWSNFKYFIIILTVSTNYIFVHLLHNSVLIVIDARYKHEERSKIVYGNLIIVCLKWKFCTGMIFRYSPWRKRLYCVMWVGCDEDSNIAANRDEMIQYWLRAAELWLRKFSRSVVKTVFPLLKPKTFKILKNETFSMSYHRFVQIIYRGKWDKWSSMS